VSAPPRWIDSHCHLQDRYRGGEGADPSEQTEQGSTPPESVGEALARAAAAGVDGLVCVGTDAATSGEALRLARAAEQGEFGTGTPRVWATVGLHPHEASTGTGAVTGVLREAAADPRTPLVAVGECGLDYHYEHSPRPAQRQAFAEQIALAHRHDLALVIHAREAWDDIFDVLTAERVPPRTVLHCFTGGAPEARRCLNAGMYLSFSGIVTFKNAADVREAAVLCPEDRLLVETDAPFLAPVPHRGKTNEPGYVPLVGAAVAELRGVDAGTLAASSAAAARAVFAR